MRLIKFTYLQYIAYVLIIILALGFLLKVGKFILAPLAIAGFLSVAFLPLLKFISKYIKSNLWSVIILTTTNFIVLGGIGLVLFKQLQKLINNFTGLSKKIQVEFSNLKKVVSNAFGIQINDFENIINSQEIIDSGSEKALLMMDNLSILLTYLFLIPLYIFFFLLYHKEINKKLKLIFSDYYLKYQRLTDDFSVLIQKYLKGLLMVMLIMGVMNSLGLFLLKVPYAFILGFSVAAFSIIPYVGIIIGSIIVLIISYATQGSLTTLLLIMALFSVIQFIEGNFLTPKIVGNQLKLNSFWAILALLIGGQLWGITGMILAIPTTAAIVVFVKQLEEKVFYKIPEKRDVIVVNDKLSPQEIILTNKNASVS